MADVVVDEAVLQWALRYALGRQTYAPTDVQNAVRANLPRLTPRFREVAIHDIDMAERTPGGLGSEHLDAPQWRALRTALRDYP